MTTTGWNLPDPTGPGWLRILDRFVADLEAAYAKDLAQAELRWARQRKESK